MKKIIVILFFVPIVFCYNAFSQVPLIQWENSYGGTGDDQASFILQTKDGGYIVGGISSSSDGDVTFNHGPAGTYDYWIVKLDPTGVIEWQKTYGGSGSEFMTGGGANPIVQTKDGGYILCGSSNSTDGDVTGNHGYLDYWVVKIDSIGTLQWEKSYGGSYLDQANSISPTTDGGYIIGGASQSNDGDVTGHHGPSGIDMYPDYWVVKIDSVGVLQWEKSYGGTYDEDEGIIQQTKDGGFIFFTDSESDDGDVTGNHGEQDYWVVKLDNTGNIQWEKSYGGSSAEIVGSIYQIKDGGYIVSGFSSSNDGDVTGHHGQPVQTADYWVVKIDSVGTLQWEKSYGGTRLEQGYSIQQTTDDGFIITGLTESLNGDIMGRVGDTLQFDYWTVKIDSLGAIQWQKSLGGTQNDYSLFVQQTKDNGFIIAGSSESNDGDVTGHHGDTGDANNNDYWIVKLGPDIYTNAIIINENDFNISPNPSTGIFNLSFAKQISTWQIYDVEGRMIMENKEKQNRSSITVDLTGKAKGIYFLRAIGEQGIINKKLILE